MPAGSTFSARVQGTGVQADHGSPAIPRNSKAEIVGGGQEGV